MKKTPALKLYIRAFSYLGPDKGLYVLGVLMSCCEFALLFALPYVNQALIDMVTGARSGNIMLTLLLMLGLFLLLVPPVVYGAFLRAKCSQRSVARVQKRIFGHICRMPHSAQVRYRTGDYITRLSDDAGRCGNMLGGFSVVQLLRFIAVFPATLILLLINDWRIALISLAYGGVNIALSMYLNPKAKGQEAVAKEEIDSSASFLVEAMRNIPVIRVFVMQKALGERYREICGRVREKRIRYQDWIGLTYGVVDFFAQSAQAVGFILGVLLSLGRGSLGQAVFNATLMGMMGDAFYRLSTFLLLAQRNLVSIERVESLLSEPLEDLDRGSDSVSTEGETAVELRDVCFSYDGKSNAIDHLSLTLRRGEHLAVVGGSGGGKSTLIKLLEGFYAPDSGEIAWFGQTGLSLRAIRSLFGYVPQECGLFDGAIGENIALCRPDASQEEVESAAKAADIHETILSLPNGYNTLAGEGGGRLSGGQRQRAAIARALLKGSPILLLDEATASLDSEVEREVQACIERVSRGMTTVTVAHRLSTVENADRILVLEGGRIVEEGDFAGLMDMRGRFWEIYEGQMREEEIMGYLER